jgi:hypothetical protein
MSLTVSPMTAPIRDQRLMDMQLLINVRWPALLFFFLCLRQRAGIPVASSCANYPNGLPPPAKGRTVIKDGSGRFVLRRNHRRKRYSREVGIAYNIQILE